MLRITVQIYRTVLQAFLVNIINEWQLKIAWPNQTTNDLDQGFLNVFIRFITITRSNIHSPEKNFMEFPFKKITNLQGFNTAYTAKESVN